MKLEEKQRRYGMAFGVGAFLIGLVITHLLSPPDLLSTEPRWKVVTWLYLNAHGVEISASNFDVFSFGTINLLSEINAPTLIAIPLFTVTLGGILLVDAVSYTTRFAYIVENAAWLLSGYLAIGIASLGLVASFGFIFLIGGLALAFAIGPLVLTSAAGASVSAVLMYCVRRLP